jgi:hypothetical protein
MTRILPRTFVAAALTLAAAVGFGQDAFDAHAADVQILQLKEVQTELKITDGQRTAMNQHAESHRKKVQAYVEQLKKDKKDPATLPQPDPKLLQFFNELKTSVVKVLQPSQLRRLREITLQNAGVAALMDQRVATRAGLSADQLKKIRAAFDAGAKEAAKIEQDTLREALKEFEGRKPTSEAEAKKMQEEAQKKIQAAMQKVRPRIEKLQTDTRNRMTAVLTAAQKKTWADLQGTQFRPK